LTLGEGPQSAEKSHNTRNALIVMMAAIVVMAALIVVADLMLIDDRGFTSGPIVSIQSVTCSGSANLVCSAELRNSGTAAVEANNATISYGRHTTPDSTCGRTRLIPSGTFTFQCSFPAGPVSSGSSFNFSVLLSSGASVSFDSHFA
jgi:hypothetical protein